MSGRQPKSFMQKRLVPLRRSYVSGGGLDRSQKRQVPNFFSNSASESAYGSFSQLPVNTVVKFVPQQEAWVVERFGKFNRILEGGLAVLVPFVERIKYVKSLKEVTVEIPHQSAITQDNVTIGIDGVLYYRVIDPYKASYGVENADYAITQLAQTTMRAEIGQLSLDRTLAERAQLNHHIVEAINAASSNWGIKCLRYEIRDIHPPENVVVAMHQQLSAERRKRAEILESEGARQAAINFAQGNKESLILQSEAQQMESINKAKGEAEGILLRAQASAKSLETVAKAIEANSNNARDAITLAVAQKYVDAWSLLARETNTMIVPGNVSDASGMIAGFLKVWDTVRPSHTNPPAPGTTGIINDESRAVDVSPAVSKGERPAK